MKRSLRLSNNKKRKIKVLLTAALSALQQGAYKQSEQCCDEVEKIYPDYNETLYIRGVLANAQGDYTAAHNHLQQAADNAPKRTDILTALAGSYLSAGNLQQAIPRYRQVLRLQPHELYAQIGLAGALVQSEAFDEAIVLLSKARKQQPGNINVRMGLFQAYHDSNQSEDAEKELHEIIKRAPDYAPAYYSLGLLKLEQGHKTQGEEAIRKAIDTAPEYTEAFTVLADIHHFSDQSDPDLQRMQKLYEQCPEDSRERMQMAFALAKAHDDLQLHAEAFTFMQEANTIRHSFSHYNETEELQRIKKVMANYQDNLAPTSNCDDSSPLFIVGMPRSGTTLIEQIISAHPDVYSTGENNLLYKALRSASNTETVDSVNCNQWEQGAYRDAAQNYLQQLQKIAPESLKFSNKSLQLITDLGLIARLFPKATIIHVRRDPLDTCFSIYKNNITGSMFDYGHDLGELGRYYTHYEQLMAHWRAHLPEGMLVEVTYEQLITDPDNEIKKLIEACKLPWNPACLQFQNNSNRVTTASMLQVRQPLYTRAIGSAKPYLTQLQPLVDALGNR